MTGKRHLKLGQLTALISFLLGTLIFGLYYLTSYSILLFVGYRFIVLTGLVNIIVLIAILIKSRKDKKNKKKLIKTSGLMLLNIPVMIIYCWIVFILLGTMRITFTNSMNSEITDINIVGCNGGHIVKLEVGERKTVWVSITNDCAISVNYLSDGQRKEELVTGYVTSGMGQKLNHKIDGQDKDIF